MKFTLGHYTLTEKYHTPTIIYSEVDAYGDEDITEFTYDTLEDAISDMLYFAWEDKIFHDTDEVKQTKPKDRPNKYREMLEMRCPHIGFISLNANVITGQKQFCPLTLQIKKYIIKA